MLCPYMLNPHNMLLVRILVRYNKHMKRKTLSEANPHLRDRAKAARQRLRSVASSTAIETGKPVSEIEARIIHLRSSPSGVKLA